MALPRPTERSSPDVPKGTETEQRARPRFGIRTRIFLGFAIVLLTFGVVSVLSVLQHQQSAATLRLLHEGLLPLALKLRDMQATDENFEAQLRSIAEGDANLSMTWLSAVRPVRRENVRDALLAIELAERRDPPADDQATLDTVRSLLASVDREYQEAEPEFASLSAALEVGNATEVSSVLATLRERQIRIGRDLSRALRNLQQRIADTSRAAGEAEEQSVSTFAVLGLVSLIAGLFVTWWAQRLLQPLLALEARVLAVARGDLSQQIEPGRDDEIGRLGTEFERMVAALAARDQRLRELQRTQDEIVATLRSGIVVVGIDGTLRASNRAADVILGEDILELGSSLDAHGLYARVPGLEAIIDEVALTGEPVAKEALALSGADGRSIDLRVTPFGTAGPSSATSSVTGPGGRRPVLAVFDDVSDALATKARLLQSERLAAMGRMAAHVTHEVRNPLSSIGLNVDLLREEVSGTEAIALLTSIQREVDRLTALTEEYLRLARVPAPTLAEEPIATVVKDTARFVSRELENAKIQLALHFGPELPVVAYDEGQIRQALLNLLRNAREAMPSGGTIEVSTVREKSREKIGGHDGVAIEVKDRGEGIPEDVRARIFDLFYSTKERGTGLGLALTREIVLAHGGEVRCDPREGGGTVFTIWLPADRPRAGSASTEAVAEEDGPARSTTSLPSEYNPAPKGP
jgi:signal transduction histidine kinase/HAMP domain-containing protein